MLPIPVIVIFLFAVVFIVSISSVSQKKRIFCQEHFVTFHYGKDVDEEWEEKIIENENIDFINYLDMVTIGEKKYYLCEQNYEATNAEYFRINPKNLESAKKDAVFILPPNAKHYSLEMRDLLYVLRKGIDASGREVIVLSEDYFTRMVFAQKISKRWHFYVVSAKLQPNGEPIYSVLSLAEHITYQTSRKLHFLLPVESVIING